MVRGWKVLVGFGAWTLFVWSARLVNIWRDLLLSTDEKVAASVVALIFLVLGLAVFAVGIGLRRWAMTRGDLIAVGALAGWTGGVWVLRTVDIVSESDLVGDCEHGLAFVVVHTVLAAISLGLAYWSWTSVASVPVTGRPEPDASEGADAAPSSVGGGAGGSIAAAMGQPINVVQKPSSVPGVLRFETNRSFTGMGKEIYHSPDDIIRDRPPDILARRLFEHGGVSTVTVYGGVVTVQVDNPAIAPQVQGIIEDLYLYYQPGDPPQMVTE